jgi:hypothetical protein
MLLQDNVLTNGHWIPFTPRRGTAGTARRERVERPNLRRHVRWRPCRLIGALEQFGVVCRELGGLGLGGSDRAPGEQHRRDDCGDRGVHQKYAPTNPTSDRMPMNCQKIRHKAVGFRLVMDDARKTNYTKHIARQLFSWLSFTHTIEKRNRWA